MEDLVTDQFFTRRSKGEVVMNPLRSWESTIIRQGQYGYRIYRETPLGTVAETFSARAVGDYTGSFRIKRAMIPNMGTVDRNLELSAFHADDASMVSTEQLCLAEALEKGTGSDALALVTLAELNKTVALMQHAASSVNGMCKVLESLGPTRVRDLDKALSAIKLLFRNMRGSNLGGRRKALRTLLRTLDKRVGAAAAAWLGYRYGVMASIYDAESWVDAAATGGKRLRVTANRVTEYDSGLVENSVPWNTYNGNATYGLQRTRRTKTSAGIIIGSEALSGADRFGVNRIASTVWELVPFSFVLDWLVDAGTRIAAFEGNFIIRPLGSWVSHDHALLYKRTFKWNKIPYYLNGANHHWFATGADEASITETCRYRVRIPNPRLSPFPQVSVKLDWKRVADSAALLAVLSKRYRSLAYALIK